MSSAGPGARRIRARSHEPPSRRASPPDADLTSFHPAVPAAMTARDTCSPARPVGDDIDVSAPAPTPSDRTP
ncbi:hypothetical protein [Streptomyces sp. NPDC055210]